MRIGRFSDSIHSWTTDVAVEGIPPLQLDHEVKKKVNKKQLVA